MKKILVIGSTVVDIIINVDCLPTTKGDIHIKSQEMSMGGCAYNVSDILRHFGTPHTLFSPIGTGIYGDYIRKVFSQKGLVSPVPTPDMDNGCCYCFVEDSGERTFISYHGAEYLIQKNWLDAIDMSEFSSIYICGLEIEEKTGLDIVEFLCDNRTVPIFFAPGPRINRIASELLDKLFQLSPILHLNEDEILGYTGEQTIKSAAQALYKKANNTIIVTAGADGAYCFDGKDLFHAAAQKVGSVVDTIGAGDSHIGALMACIYRGDTLQKATETANKIAAAVVSTKGALLKEKDFRKLLESL
ncbi:MAG: PfkB family carbohydrate kinase [Oscillospiraceae bacterium]